MNAVTDFPMEYRIPYFLQPTGGAVAAAQSPPAPFPAVETGPSPKAAGAGFSTWNDAFGGPVARWFGVGDRDQAKSAHTWYSVSSPKPEQLSFEVSNNSLGASLLRNGTVRAAAVLTRVGPATYKENSLRGVFAEREMIGAGPWKVGVALAERPPAHPAAVPGPRVDLLDGLFPVFRWQQGNAAVDLLYFAPADPQTLSQQPRALIAVIKVTNTGAAPVKARVEIEGVEPLSPALPAGARSAVLPLDQPASPGGADSLELPAGASLIRSFAFVVGANAAELHDTAARVSGRKALDWLNETRAWRLSQLGSLSIPEAPHVAEMLTRYVEMCRQSVFYQPDGTFGAGGLGPDCDLPPVANVWMRDTFYQMLAMSHWQPRLTADSIRFFLRYGMPPKPYGRGTKRFPGAGPVTHSLSNALTPFVLAGAYYQATGDKVFLQACPELLAGAKERFAEMLASRKNPEVFLFPSMYISDGDARGDYHTGTNVFAWAALRAMARLAREVYEEEALAAEWSALAEKVQADLLARCAGPSPEGWRFFEGANADGTFVPGHDGEESDVALLSYYGLMEADHPAIVNHSRLSLTPLNPLYDPKVDGVLWVDGKEEFPATFPAWVSALAGARDEAELQGGLDRIVQRTDLNGSPWWWPYSKPRPAGGMKAVSRRYGNGPVTQCGWAAGVFVCKFVHDVLGIQVDVPARRAAFRPFAPWNQFAWKGASFGSAKFDVKYEKDPQRLTATMTNRNPEAYECTVELLLPPDAEIAESRIGGNRVSDLPQGTRYGRRTVRLVRRVESGESLTLEVLIRPTTRP